MPAFHPWTPAALSAFEAQRKTKPPADLISVCVTVYNYADYLPDCLDSLAAQTYTHLDIVIVDDKSERDDSLDVAIAWAKANAARF